MMRKNLFIASEVRSGSTFIAETIAYHLENILDLGVWGLTNEIFNTLDGSSSCEDIIKIYDKMHINRENLCSAKIMCAALSVIYNKSKSLIELKEKFFGEHSFWIVIRRRDRISQAVSLAFARKSGVYHHYENPEKSADHNLLVSIEEIEDSLKAIAISDVYLENFANAMPKQNTIQVFYEDFLNQEKETLEQIYNKFGYLKVSMENYINLSKLKKTADDQKISHCEKYREWLLSNYFH